MREADKRYFDRIERRVEDAFSVARAAKDQGKDPETEVEIPVAKDMADRVENILGIDGVAERVRELDAEMSREEAALELARDFAEDRVGDYESREGKIEGAVRTAVALLTEGVVAAPIEGIDRVELLENDDGTEFVRVFYAGPIRSAGGTAQALSVLVADYARSLLGIDRYKPREDEIERYAEEIDLYDEETGLQYTPKPAETKFIARHCPIMLDGESTGAEEVSGFRDLERVDTNNPRGGMCLVLAEGIALKVPKIQRYTDQLEEVEWPWLEDLKQDAVTDGGTTTETDANTNADGDGDADIEGELATEPAAADAGAETATTTSTADDGDVDDPRTDVDADPTRQEPPRVDPEKKFLRDLIAGRPVFSHPGAEGGFRLRYGRARNHGFATAGVHPATMHLVDDFLATGTQIKTERPGKAAGVVPVDSIEGPTVKLATGEVRRIDDPQEARAVRNGVTDILDLGEYLVNYGEFIENNHPLAPASYVVEWWEQDVAAGGGDLQALRDDPSVDLADPSAEQAIEWAETFDVPLHPSYTYLWHDIDADAFERLATAVTDGRIEETAQEQGLTLQLDYTDDIAETLETLLVEHIQEDATITIPDALGLLRSLGVTRDLERTWHELPEDAREWPNAMQAVNAVAPFVVRERAPTRIGNRMGRPEKSEVRELSPAVHTLFPIGEGGGNQRDVTAAATHAEGMQDVPGQITVDVGRRRCPDCGTETYTPACPDCDGHTESVYACPDCDIEVEPDESGRTECPRCGRTATAVEPRDIDLRTVYQDALASVGERENAFEMLKGVKGLSSTEKTPEPIEKGILRAKHGVSTFKDGTVRYDMTDLPVTSVRPSEIDVSAETFRGLGYETDIHGDPLQYDDQLVELRVQDVILSDGAAEHMMRVADFVDDLLVNFYDLEPFYEVEDREDLVGELVFGMAPHTSAAVVGRVVGFTSAAVGYAHPYFHASKRRNCDGDEDCVMLLMDGLLNFSKSYLPDKRGGSVAEDSRLLAIDPDGEIRFMTFDEFWQELESPNDHDGKFRKKTCLDEGWQTYAFDDTHNASLKPIEKAIRYRADPDEQLLRVETQFGRSLAITEHHSLFRYNDGIEEVAGADLEAGDLVVAPRQFDIEPKRTTIDVTEVLDEPYVIIDDEVESYLTTAWEAADRGDAVRTTFQRGLSYRLQRRKLSYDRFRQLLDRSTVSDVPTDIQIGVPGSSDGIQREIDVDADFGWLLGLFVAAGSLSAVRPTIHTADEALAERVATTTKHVLGSEPTVRWSNEDYAVGFPDVFRDVLSDLGFETRDASRSSEKVIPDCILRAEREVVLSFIRGFVAGDGSKSSDDNGTSISFHTTSEAVKDGFVFLLHRLGLVANVSRIDRDPPSQPGYRISVSDGQSDNSLQRILEGEESSLPETLVVPIPDGLMAIREMDIEGVNQLIPKSLKHRETVSLEKLQAMIEALDQRDLPDAARNRLAAMRPLVDGDLSYLRVNEIEHVDYDGYLYDLQVGGEPVFTANWLYAHNSMDAPLVMSSRIDPTEIDDEAHNVDIVEQYPRKFYEATRRMADPGSVDITIAEDTLETNRQYTGFRHTHDTTNIAAGPDLSAYKTLGSMTEKMDAQLALARKLRAVDETDVAERIIEYHFLPDLLGNLRAFSRQETRCLDCGMKYRRVPLTGICRECGGDMTLTVHEGSVNKYLDTALEIAQEFGVREYTKQRLRILERSIERIFEDDTNKQSGIADFM